VFCLEEIRPGASVCPHCHSNLTPLQGFAERQAALEERLAGLERDIAALRTAAASDGASTAAPAAPASPAAPAMAADIRWPHMVDNIFLGLCALLAAHWLATTLPGGNRSVFRLVALIVALPFGFRFERNSRSGTAGQVVAALAFGSLGTLAVGTLDIVVGGHRLPPVTAQEIAAFLATIALSHYAGSTLAHFRQARLERQTTASPPLVPAFVAGGAGSLMRIEPARIKSTAETIKALYDAAAPLAAGVAALWAAFGHILF
jgi:hypothetical protein